jgi:hypothetical protein
VGGGDGVGHGSTGLPRFARNDKEAIRG